MNETLRVRVKTLKIMQGISYKEIAEYMEVKPDTFYHWLYGAFNWTDDNQKRLYEIVCNLSI